MSVARVKALLATAENRETFFVRIARLYPESDKRYQRIVRAYDTAKNAFRHKYRGT